jgi:hypothetical protein
MGTYYRNGEIENLSESFALLKQVFPTVGDDTLLLVAALDRINQRLDDLHITLTGVAASIENLDHTIDDRKS